MRVVAPPQRVLVHLHAPKKYVAQRLAERCTRTPVNRCVNVPPFPFGVSVICLQYNKEVLALFLKSA